VVSGSGVQCFIDDGHYSDIHRNSAAGRASVGGRSSSHDHYQRLNVEQINANQGDQLTTDPGAGDEAARSQGREGLDPPVLATLR